MRAISLLFLILVACGEGARTATNTIEPADPRPAPTPQVIAPAPVVSTEGSPRESAEPRAEMIPVTIYDGRIEAPRAFTGGLVVFEVTNRGTIPHALVVEEQGERKGSLEDVPAGRQMMLQVLLGPGSHRLYCPLPRHNEQVAVAVSAAD